jgi:hypothetical protein
MYNGFSDKDAYSVEWFEIAKNFLKLAFVGECANNVNASITGYI